MRSLMTPADIPDSMIEEWEALLFSSINDEKITDIFEFETGIPRPDPRVASCSEVTLYFIKFIPWAHKGLWKGSEK